MHPYSPIRVARLGQQASRMLTVVVTDFNGRPLAGAEVSVGGKSGRTNSDGVFRVEAQGPSMVMATVGEYSVSEDLSEPVTYLRIPVCLSQPLLTLPEGVALLGAAALTGAGFYWKVEALKVTGEILFGAGAFTALYRLSCL